MAAAAPTSYDQRRSIRSLGGCARPVGPANLGRPPPSRGLLILEVKDWKLDTIHSIDKQHAAIRTDQGIKHVLNPQEQARQYMFAVTNKLERDPQLVWPNGSLKGKPFFPYGHGVVFPNITRKQFDGANIGDVLPSHLVICQDEMTESADVEELLVAVTNV